MRNLGEIYDKIEELRKHAAQERKRELNEKDLYKKIPIGVIVERFESAANALEWVIED